MVRPPETLCEISLIWAGKKNIAAELVRSALTARDIVQARLDAISC
jgi:hypothetical protein